MISQDVKIRVTDENQFNEVRAILIGHGYKYLFNYEKHLVGIVVYSNNKDIGFFVSCRDFRIKAIPEITKDEIGLYFKDEQQIKTPIGNFIRDNSECIQGENGAYYHYHDVINLLKKFKNEK